jgi:hypothetical protein
MSCDEWLSLGKSRWLVTLGHHLREPWQIVKSDCWNCSHQLEPDCHYWRVEGRKREMAP